MQVILYNVHTLVVTLLESVFILVGGMTSLVEGMSSVVAGMASLVECMFCLMEGMANVLRGGQCSEKHGQPTGGLFESQNSNFLPCLSISIFVYPVSPFCVECISEGSRYVVPV